MWWVWCAQALAGAPEDLKAIQEAGQTIVAAHAEEGCTLSPLQLPRRLRTPQQQAAAVATVRVRLARWQRQAAACEGVHEEALDTVETIPQGSAEAVAWLREQGHPEAALRWERLAALSQQDAVGLGGCSCMGEDVPGIPIVYGYPSRGLIRQARRGEVVLGGCVVYDGMPYVDCPAGCLTR